MKTAVLAAVSEDVCFVSSSLLFEMFVKLFHANLFFLDVTGWVFFIFPTETVSIP